METDSATTECLRRYKNSTKIGFSFTANLGTKPLPTTAVVYGHVLQCLWL